MDLPFDFRRSIDLRLDADGHWFHDGEPFQHAGLIALFDRGIDVDEGTGEPILRVGDKWCYIRCDDVPFVVRTLRISSDHADLTLNTGAEVSLRGEAFRLGPNGVLYAELGPKRRARLSRTAQAALAPALDEADGAYVLTLGGRRTPLPPLT